MKFKTIRLHKENDLAVITLNRADHLNVLNSLVLGELDAALTEIERDKGIGVVILTGGEQCFSAGFDIAEISECASPADARKFFREAHGVFDRLEELEQPVVAAIAGLALGGGCELALACDLRIAADNATFGLPEVKIGMIPGGGGTQRLPRLIGMTKAKELVLTGDYLSAEEALQCGLLNKVVAVSLVLKTAKTLAAKIAQHPLSAVKAVKLAVNGGWSMDIKSAIAYEARCFDAIFATEEQREGMLAYMEKRTPIFKQK